MKDKEFVLCFVNTTSRKKVFQLETREPTTENKKLIKSKGLRPDMWLVIWEGKDVLEVISKRTRRRRVLVKGGEVASS